MKFFGTIALIFSIIALIAFSVVLNGYFKTGLVEQFPTLIVSGVVFTFAMLSLVCGMILEVIAKKHKQLYEILVNLNKRNIENSK